jgi:hypothetical protein
MLVKQAEMQHQQELDLANLEFEKWKSELQASTQITIAEISAKVQSNNALIAAESKAAQNVSKSVS